VKILIDECLHTSLVAVAEGRGHEARHVNWLGLSGEADWDLMPRIIADDFTFVTNNASDFRKLYARQPLHAGLLIIIPQVAPARQRELFDLLLDEIDAAGEPVNEAIEIRLEDGEAVLDRYPLPAADA
jgi:predicted nuclease of predicted toxin-antitoxin system